MYLCLAVFLLLHEQITHLHLTLIMHYNVYLLLCWFLLKRGLTQSKISPNYTTPVWTSSCNSWFVGEINFHISSQCKHWYMVRSLLHSTFRKAVHFSRQLSGVFKPFKKEIILFMGPWWHSKSLKTLKLYRRCKELQIMQCFIYIHYNIFLHMTFKFKNAVLWIIYKDFGNELWLVLLPDPPFNIPNTISEPCLCICLQPVNAMHHTSYHLHHSH